MAEKPNKPPAFQWYAKDWLTDDKRAELPPEGRGAYADLLSYEWINGAIPSDPETIGGIVNLPADRVTHFLEGALGRAFPLVNGKRQNPKLEAYREELKTRRKLKSNAGKAGAQARWSQRVGGTRTVLPLAEPIANDSPSPSSLTTIDSDRVFEDRFWKPYRRGKNSNGKSVSKGSKPLTVKAWRARLREGVNMWLIVAGFDKADAHFRARASVEEDEGVWGYMPQAQNFLSPTKRYWERDWALPKAVQRVLEAEEEGPLGLDFHK